MIEFRKKRARERESRRERENTRNSSVVPHAQNNTYVYLTNGIESTRARRETRDQATQKHRRQRGNDYSTVRGHRRFGLGAGVGTRHEQRLFKMELAGDAELRAQRDFGARRVQGKRERDVNFFFI